MTDLDGLASLREVTDTLEILFSPMLANVDGLASLTKVGSLTLNANASLHDVDGLIGLTVVDRDLTIANSGVVSIEGLANLTTVGGALSLHAPMSRAFAASARCGRSDRSSSRRRRRRSTTWNRSRPFPRNW